MKEGKEGTESTERIREINHDEYMDCTPKTGEKIVVPNSWSPHSMS